MRIKYVLPIMLVLLVGIASFVIADFDEGNDYSATITLEKGWNLVSIYAIRNAVDVDQGEWDRKQIKAMDIRAIFFYDKYNNEYIQTYPNKEEEKLNELISKIDPETTGNYEDYWRYVSSSMWVYSNKKQSISYSTFDGPAPIDMITLKFGWNFLTILPDMTGKQLGEIAGSCNIEKAHGWWAERQTWDLIALDGGKFNDEIEMTGLGLIIKVPSDCTLGSGGTSPPGLPNGDSAECTDSDGGSVIDVKGKTGNLETEEFNNDVCFIKESETETTSTTECSGNNCYLKEYRCDSQGNVYSEDVLCEEHAGFTSCQDGVCI